jgi:hypothetical protein
LASRNEGLSGGRPALAPVLLALMLGACSGFGGSSTPAATDANTFPKNYRQEVAEFMRRSLENPVKVKDAFISEPALKPVAGMTHYVSCVRFNPRNTEGQYQGNTERIALFLGGRLNQFLPMERDACAGAAYQRFPEAEVLVP